MRDYGKVFGTFWSSETTGTLSDDGKMLALYLMTCQHATIAGVFRLPDGYAAEDLRWTVERVSEGFAELLRKGFANRCATTKWVWVRKHLEWNPLDNPNMRKAAAKIAMSVPAECTWRLDFMRACAEVLALKLPEAQNPSETVPKGFANQEQEQKQKAGTEDLPPQSGAPGSADKETKPLSAKDLEAEGVDPKVAADWLSVRKAKKAPLTVTAWAAVKREAAAAGMTPAQAVKHAAENGWQGFKASWLKGDEAKGQSADWRQDGIYAGAL